MKPNPAILLITILMALLVACTAAAEATPPGGADPASTGAGGAPPAAILVVGDQEQVAGVGSYCWTPPKALAGVCTNKIGIPTRRTPLQAASPVAARFKLPLTERPSLVELRVVPVTDLDELMDRGGGLHWWAANAGEDHSLSRVTEPEIELTLVPGRYVLRLNARWNGIGDVIYGFLLDVR